ncbi:MAG: TonB-dependent receptor domain-containing protein, partial [Gammaproteobacteria bacterium]
MTGNSQLSIFGGGLPGRRWRAFDYNFFIQDDWKLSSRLTLNLGLRYELDLPIYDTRGRLATFDPTLYRPRMQVDAQGNPVGPPVEGWVQAGNVIPSFDLPEIPNVSNGVVDSSDPNNLAPRVGFAWSPLGSSSLVVR